jgi:hypothetical protein
MIGTARLRGIHLDRMGKSYRDSHSSLVQLPHNAGRTGKGWNPSKITF